MEHVVYDINKIGAELAVDAAKVSGDVAEIDGRYSGDRGEILGRSAQSLPWMPPRRLPPALTPNPTEPLTLTPDLNP